MTKPRLHLDADASRISLVRELLKRGHDVTRTPNPWMRLDATDEQQILGATAQGRIIFTFNIRDFIFFIEAFHAAWRYSSFNPTADAGIIKWVG